MDHLIFVRKAYIPNFRPLVPFLHVKKFVVVGGGWVLNWILVLRFGPNLELRLEAGPSLTKDISGQKNKLGLNLRRKRSFFGQ